MLRVIQRTLLKGGQVKGKGSLCFSVWRNNVISPLGSMGWGRGGGGLGEICLFILKGGEIQYSSDGNWIVPDTTCLFLSLALSFSLSLFHNFSPGQSVLRQQRLSFCSYICHKWFPPTAALHSALNTRRKLFECPCIFKYFRNEVLRN